MGPVFQLVYLSQAAEDISYSDIQDILEVSRNNNKMDEVTGVLIFRDGHFLQLLEGREQDVKKVLSKILMDDRNHSIRVLIETTTEARLFSNWTMAFYDGDISSNETEDLIELFDTCLKGNRRTMIIPMLKKFQASAPAPQ
ncbi:MAG: hypothetical protein OM95_01985 [Bdellovibrio sp. ArHS]|uniref:BLUF domain-containing protein n=1 Tax=Bdellovibrio sp. ArHS TaxID=1569284 RepID=UPI000583A7A7|nr:BLUF domain-containing protein [Bdellovibrio sp. ArHS]KHD89852.1 MAG: hypothetical protein OM95_01985 [Bdellovibrio sp. ArHS]